MSSYVAVNNDETHCKSLNLNGTMHENKFVTNVHLGRITFSRPIADWDSLMSKHTNSSIKKSHCCLKSFSCSKQQWKSYSIYFIKSIFPCIDILTHYNWRSDFLKDISGGLTIGVMNIPQGKYNLLFIYDMSVSMAYSLLAGLPPVYGLYIGFLSPLFYAIFGRCTQFSMGTFAVVSLLIVGPIEQHSSKVAVNHHNSIINSNSTLVEDIITNKLPLQYSEPRAIVAVTLTFLVGIIQASFDIYLIRRF
uniref:Sulfate transporter 4.1, chloroplastic n=1 Tax=Schistosoma haematobium TaxID=6185 RepID=A0A095A223_SCHHA